LAAGKGVLFPADIERREQNNGVEPATVLIAGLISGDVGLSIPVAPTPTATAIPSPTAIPTDTSTPGPTSTPRPTNTPVPSPTATSTPEPGTAMYEADTDGGLDEWNGPTDWKHLNGMLVNDGYNDSAGVWIAAPYAPRDSDYAVEAEIQLISSYCADGGGSQYESFGIVLRSTDVDSGYWVGVDCDGFGAISLGSNFCCDRLGNQNFAADLDWHTMRAEVEGNVIRLYIDGSLLLEVSDNRFLESGSIGLWTYGVQVNVRGFRVIVI
jgi:hypothetical protein